MADEKTEEKVKQTVPAMVRSAKGVADHAAAVQEMQWDKERRAFKDPFTVTMALFAYAKLLGSLLDEAELRLRLEQTAFAKRIAEFETRLTTIESWKVETALQGAEMMERFKEMVTGGGSPIDHLKALLSSEEQPPTAPPAQALVTVAAEKPVDVSKGVEMSVVPIKPDKQKKPDERKKSDEKREEKGGAA